MDQRRSGVLIVITGGNIGLFVTAGKREETVLEPASLESIRRIVLGDEAATSLTLREGGLQGVTVPVTFRDLRQDTRRRYSDAEELDSAQVEPLLWAHLAQTISDEYAAYEGFVVLHGLDTMAYTASALSFMIPNLQHPIVLTGSQLPLNYPRTDAVQNIMSAITLAAGRSLGIAPVIPEVCVYSYDTLFRGNRVSMVSASSYRAFDSSNFPPLASVGEHIELQTHLIRERSQSKSLNLRTSVKARVVILDVFPGMDAATIEGLTTSSEIRGVLLRTYGMGTAPTSPEVLRALDGLNQAGIVVMNVTQARSGRISHGTDPVSLRLFEQGVISGVDLTAEAAYAKMVVALSEESDASVVADRLQIETCGEQSLSVFNIHFAPGETRDEDASEGSRAVLKPRADVVEKHKIHLDNVMYLQLRLLGLEPVNKQRGKSVNRTIEMDAHLVDPNAETGDKRSALHLKHDMLRWSKTGRSTINVAYDVTFSKDRLLSPDRIPSSLLMLETNEPIRWKRLDILIYHSNQAS